MIYKDREDYYIENIYARNPVKIKVQIDGIEREITLDMSQAIDVCLAYDAIFEMDCLAGVIDSGIDPRFSLAHIDEADIKHVSEVIVANNLFEQECEDSHRYVRLNALRDELLSDA